jgi:hypothetical protein
MRAATRTISDMTGDEFSEAVSARISARDLDRLNRMSARRGIEREKLIRMAIDALLAQEAWSGGFIPPPPAARVLPPIDERGRIRHARRFGRRPRTS